MRKTKKLVKAKRALCALTAGILATGMVMPVFAQDEVITPQSADYGYYVDNYKKNGESGVKDTIDNPANGVLSEMLKYFTPGTSWDNGTILNKTIHEMNIAESSKIRNGASESQQVLAFYDDIRDKNYSMISGLGKYSDKFKKGVNAQSYIIKSDEYKNSGKSEADYTDNTAEWSATVPSDAENNKYMDVHSDAVWACATGDYAGIVNLVAALRGGAASTSPAKKFYKYMRPFRWSRTDSSLSKVTILSSLTKMEKSDPSNDGGYPSGHTNAAYLAAIAMAYSVPEQYSELMLRASELGYDRIVAGMHSCLDVIGGRMTSTAIAASNLYDSANSDVKAAAVESGNKLTGNDSTVEEKSDYDAYQKDKETYLYRMTYNIKEDNADTTKKAVVPKGAEVLLESRYPYLDDSQIRYILYSTAVSSGYSVLDDAEGWGRLNLFEAANGYGAFDTNVTVNMDASKGGFNVADNWKNDISGTGSLTKEGSGMLVLSGNNSYTGNTIVDGGSIRADYASAFGNSSIVNNSVINENTDDTLIINGNYKQNKSGVLELTISNENDYVDITGNAELGGKLVLNFKDYIPSTDAEIIKCASVASQFDEIEINAPEGFEVKIAYNDNGVDLVFSQKTDNNTAQNEISSPQTGDTSHVVMAFTAFVLSLAGILTASFASKIKSDRIR